MHENILEVVLRKNLFNLFIDKILDIPFWIKQVIYIKLMKEMKEAHCDVSIRENYKNFFSMYVPTLTFSGETELAERKCGLDNNIYTFLQCCADGLSIIEISVNTFLSMEEVAKYFELCVEQNFIKAPESKEVYAMAGYIAGKFRIGEYFKQKGIISADELEMAVLKYKELEDAGKPKKFADVMISMGYISKEQIKAVLVLKEESKKRFILDYNSIPKCEITHVNENQKYQEEMNNLKEENLKLKKKMLQLLELVKRNA